ncbi:MAG: alpha-L-fucosidase [Phycisphaerae bacterium]
MPHIAPWFPQAKFGVFIHWVLKAAMNDPHVRKQQEQESTFRKNPQPFADRFTAENFDADEWARMFKSWGAKYAVLTTKHHIGFALFDHPDSPFTAARNSPAGRDLVAEYVEALHKAGLKVGLYYSLPDWSHPDYASLAGGDDPMKYSPTDEPERWNRFVEHMFEEIRHLCTAYGRIDLLWFDGDWERTAEQWRTPQLVEMIERLQPGIVLNNRLRHSCLGHYGSPEQACPLAPPRGWWEFCMTPGDNWDGYQANINVKPAGELVRIFGDVLGMGGNMLLNVAPDTDGTIADVQTQAMGGLGTWITDHAEAVYGAEPGLPAGLFNGSSTHKGSLLYLICYDTPRDELVVKGLKSEVKRVTHMRTGTELAFRCSGGRAQFGKAGWLYVKLPAELMDDYASVVRVEFADDECVVQTPDGKTLTWRGRPTLTEQAAYEQRD